MSDSSILQLVSNTTLHLFTHLATSTVDAVICHILQEYNTRDMGDTFTDKWKSLLRRADGEPLLDDEDLPEDNFDNTSPQLNTFKSIDDSLLESAPEWRLVSDESFLNMEQMVMSPVKTPFKEVIKKEVDVATLISFSPFQKPNKIIPEDVETSTADNEYETCESGESRMTLSQKISPQETSDYITCNSSQESKSSNAKILISYQLPQNTLDDVDTLTTDRSSEDTYTTNASSNGRDSSGVSSRPSGSNESAKFNDTLEDMEHLMKFGMNYMTSIENKPEEKEEATELKPEKLFGKYFDNGITFNAPFATTKIQKGLNKKSYDIAKDDLKTMPKYNFGNYREPKEMSGNSPIVKKTAVKKIQKESILNKENKFRLKSPRLLIPTATDSKSSFQPPKKTPTKTPKKFFYDTPPKTTPKVTTPKSTTPSQFTPAHSTPSKYTNIMSPVQYYIKNSPVVPKIQNVSPGVNLWAKQSHRAPSKGRTVESPKDEGVKLKEKAYQQPKITKVIETVEQRLPKNFKVGLMAESLPKPLVIKHQRKAGPPLREQNNLQRQTTNRDSFANMAVTGGDISVCIEKPATRTRTLK